MAIVVRFESRRSRAVTFREVDVVLSQRIAAIGPSQQGEENVLGFEVVGDRAARRQFERAVVEISQCVRNLLVARTQLQQRPRLDQERSMIADIVDNRESLALETPQ